MKTTRKFEISDKVFSLADIQKVAAIVRSAVPTDAPSERPVIQNEVTFDDNSRIEGLDEEVFNEEELIRASRPAEIDMRVMTFGPMDLNISVNLREGSSIYGNTVRISASNRDIVNTTYTRLTDAITAVQPQTIWIRKHRTLFLNLLALGLGTVLVDFARFAAIYVVRHSPPFALEPAKGMLTSLVFTFEGLHPYFAEWISRWALGLPAAALTRMWLLSMWPSIEFNFGAQHLRAQHRRGKLVGVLTLVLLPLLVSFVYDFIKPMLY